MKKQLLKNSTMLCSVLALNTLPALAGGLPSGGHVASGSATINQQGANRLVINQNSDKAIIDWQTFSVDSGSSVHFQQPSSSSTTLNRVLSSTPSTIAGQLTATGDVFLVNPNGILITKDGLIDTNSFLGSTLDIKNEDFLKENYVFTKQKGKKNALVENRGRILADSFAVLMGASVQSHGIIRVHLGRIGLGAGEEIIMTMGNNNFLRVAVSTKDLKGLRNSEGNTVSAVINHSGKLVADGGFIDISVKSARNILRQVVNLNGIAQARTVKKKKGRLVFGGADSFTGTGKLDVSAKHNDGGSADSGASAGDIDIDVGDMNFSGKMHAKSDSGDGGSIDVNAGGAVSLSQGAEFDASGYKDGGRISLIGGQTRLMGSADFKARGETGNGGQIDISTRGGTVALLSGKIDASGHIRGGLVRIGGAFQGGNYDAQTSTLSQDAKDSFVNRWHEHAKHIIPNSSRTSISIGYKVDASARGHNGVGGTIVLWSDGQTNQMGEMIATGQKSGGSIEISGKQKIGAVEASKQKIGAGGHMLFDPKNVTIIKDRGLSLLKKLAYVEKKPTHDKKLSLKTGDLFGRSVAVDGNRLAVGASGDSNHGAVYLFTVDWHSGALIQNKKITHGSDIGNGYKLSLKTNDYFGSSVALRGKYLAVGASGDNTGGEDRGAVYLFKINWNHNTIYQRKKLAHGTTLSSGNLDLHNNNSNFGSGVSLYDDKLAVGALGNNTGGIRRGAVYLFTIDWNTGTVTQNKKIDSNFSGLNLRDSDNFGVSVSLYGNKLAVGADGDDEGGTDRGAVYLFAINWDTNAVIKAKKIDSNTEIDSSKNKLNLANGDNFGASVSLNGNTLAVGAYGDDTGGSAGANRGAVYLFRGNWNTGAFLKKGKIAHGTPSGLSLANGDRFGTSVALDGDRLVVGAEDTSTGGSVYLFTGNWLTGTAKQVGETITHDRDITGKGGKLSIGSGDGFGKSVALKGNKLAVGAWGDQGLTPSISARNRGAVYLFTVDWNAGTIVQKTKIHDNPAVGFHLGHSDYFGTSVALSGNRLAVGAMGDGAYGAAYLFTVNWDTGTVTQNMKITYSASSPLSILSGDHFGSSVALDGNRLAVGASHDGTGGDNRGAVYLLTVDWSSNTYTLNKKIAHDTVSGLSLANDDNFGYDVSLQGNRLAVGAYKDSISGDVRGAVYLFAVDWNTNAVTKKLKIAHGTVSGLSLNDHDYFGSSVALDNNRLAVGALYDGTGSASKGAVYLFTINWGSSTTATLNKKIAHDATSLPLSTGDKFGSSVALDNNRLIVGADGDGDGAVYAFTVNWGSTTTVTRIGTKLAHGTPLHVTRRLFLNSGDEFGSSVAVRGERLAVGAIGDSTGGARRGAVYLFTVNWKNGTITQKTKITHGTSTNYRGGTLRLKDYDNFGRSVALYKNRLAVGADGDDTDGSSRGAVYLFTFNWTTNHITNNAKINSRTSGLTLRDYDYFGSSIALQNDKLVVGAWGDDTGDTSTNSKRGAAYLFRINWGSTITATKKLKIDSTTDIDGSGGTIGLTNHNYFGRGVALDGDKLAVGAEGDHDSKGAVYLFTVNWGSSTTVTKRLKIDHTTTGLSLDSHDWFGNAVALQGDRLVVGAVGDDTGGTGSDANRGAVYLFNINWTTYTATKKQKIAHNGSSLSLQDGDKFGRGVAIDGDRLAVGIANKDHYKGGVYLFTANWISGAVSRVGAPIGNYTNTNRIFATKTTIEHRTSDFSLTNGDKFGSSVALDGNRMAVGAMGTSSNKGAVYLFTVNWEFGNIIQHHKIYSLNANDKFGRAVALDGDRLAVGAAGDANDKGTVHLYTYDWNSNKLFDNQTLQNGSPSGLTLANGYKFGTSVALDGDRLAVGATGEDTGKGAVYLFKVNWTAKTASKTQHIHSGTPSTLTLTNHSNFGSGVALDGDKLAVGATGEDSAKGAVYLFNINWTTNTATKKQRIAHGTPSTLTLANSDFFGSSVALDGDKLAVGAVYSPAGGVGNRGAVYLFKIDWTANTATKKQKIEHGNPTSLSIAGEDRFGGAVALDGNRLVVGSYGKDTGKGAVYLYTINWTTGAATQVGNTIANGRGMHYYKTTAYKPKSPVGNDKFGASVALDGTKLAVGATGYDGGRGAVYLFDFNDDTGVTKLRRKIMHNVNIGTSSAHGHGHGHYLYLNKGDKFGSSLALQGDKLVVGAYGTGHGNGAVYLFKMNWTNDHITITKNRYIGNTPSGAFSGADTIASNSYFGSAVALKGNRLAVGAYGTDGGKGAVYLLDIDWASSAIGFTKRKKIDHNTDIDGSGGKLSLVANAFGSGGSLTTHGSYFGSALAITGSSGNYTLAIGAYGDSTGKGAVYLFDTKWSSTPSDTITTTKTHKIENGSTIGGETLSLANYDYFGSALAYGYKRDSSGNVLGTYLVVGAKATDSGKGAFYVIEKDKKWMHKIKNSTKTDGADTQVRLADNDLYGSAIAISGDRMIVGARGDDNGRGAIYNYKLNWDMIEAAATTSIIHVQDIINTLNAGTNYNVTADNTVTSLADIIATTGNGALNITAGKSVLFKKAINIKGNLNITAGASSVTSERDDGTAQITMDGNVTSTHGNISLVMQDGNSSATTAKRRSGDITTKGTVTALAGTLTMTAGRSVLANGNITAKNGIDIKANALDNRADGTAVITTDGTLTSSHGNINLELKNTSFTSGASTKLAGDITTNGAITANDGALTITAGKSALIKQNITAKDGIDIKANTLSHRATGVAEITTDGSLTSSDGNINLELKNISGKSAGDITTKGAITATDGNLTMTAGRSVLAEGNITAKNGIDIKANALDHRATGTAEITTDGSLTSSTGNIHLIMQNTSFTSSTDKLTGDITTNGTITATAGTLHMTAGKSIIIKNNITAHIGMDIKANALTNRANGTAQITVDGDMTANNSFVKMMMYDRNTSKTDNTKLSGAITLNGDITAKKILIYHEWKQYGTTHANNNRQVTIGAGKTLNATYTGGGSHHAGDVTLKIMTERLQNNGAIQVSSDRRLMLHLQSPEGQKIGTTNYHYVMTNIYKMPEDTVSNGSKDFHDLDGDKYSAGGKVFVPVADRKKSAVFYGRGYEKITGQISKYYNIRYTGTLPIRKEKDGSSDYQYDKKDIKVDYYYGYNNEMLHKYVAEKRKSHFTYKYADLGAAKFYNSPNGLLKKITIGGKQINTLNQAGSTETSGTDATHVRAQFRMWGLQDVNGKRVYDRSMTYNNFQPDIVTGNQDLTKAWGSGRRTLSGFLWGPGEIFEPFVSQSPFEIFGFIPPTSFLDFTESEPIAVAASAPAPTTTAQGQDADDSTSSSCLNLELEEVSTSLCFDD